MHPNSNPRFQIQSIDLLTLDREILVVILDLGLRHDLLAALLRGGVLVVAVGVRILSLALARRGLRGATGGFLLGSIIRHRGAGLQSLELVLESAAEAFNHPLTGDDGAAGGTRGALRELVRVFQTFDAGLMAYIVVELDLGVVDESEKVCELGLACQMRI